MTKRYTLEIIVEAIDRASRQFRDVAGGLSALGDEAASLSRRMRPAGQAMAAAGAAGMALLSSSVLVAARTEELGFALDAVAEAARREAEAQGDLDRARALSADSVREYVEAVQEKGITEQTALQLVSQMIRYNLDLASATDLARVAQDAAIFAMADSSETLDRLIYGITTYNVRVLRTAGITVSAEDAFKSMANTLGVTTDDLTEAQKMQAMLNAVLEQGESIAGAYEAAMGSAGKQLRSLTNREFLEFRQELGQALLPLFSEAIIKTRALVKWFIDLDDATKATISRVVALASGVSLVAGAVILATPRIIALFNAFGTLASTAGDVAMAMRLIAMGTSATSLGLAGVLAVAIPVVAALAAVAAIAYHQYQQEKKLREAVDGATESYEDYILVLRDAGRETQALTRDTYNQMSEMERAREIYDQLTAAIEERTEVLEEAEDAWQATLRSETDVMGTEAAMARMVYEEAAAEAERLRMERAHYQYLLDAEWATRVLEQTEARRIEQLDVATEAEKSYYDAMSDVNVAVSDLALAIRGPVAEAEGNFLERHRELTSQLEAERAKLAELKDAAAQSPWLDYAAQISETQASITGLVGSIAELRQEHDDAMAKIIFDILQARLALDGWTEDEWEFAMAVARDLGLVDEKTWNVIQSVNEAWNTFVTEGVDPAVAAIRGIHDELTRIPTQIPIEFQIHTTGGAGVPGWQPLTPYQRGAWDVPATAPALVHRGEMVLPARIAEAVRGALQGGGGGGAEFHLHLEVSENERGGVIRDFQMMQALV